MLNTQIMDIKINANELKQIKNIDMCKSATLPQTLSPFSSPIKLPPKNFNNNQIKDAIIEDESPGKKSNMEKSNTMCLVCFDKVPDAVFMECGHGGVCYECAFELFKATGECYLCRQVNIN